MSQAIPHSNIKSHNFMELLQWFFDNNYFDILSLEYTMIWYIFMLFLRIDYFQNKCNYECFCDLSNVASEVSWSPKPAVRIINDDQSTPSWFRQDDHEKPLHDYMLTLNSKEAQVRIKTLITIKISLLIYCYNMTYCHEVLLQYYCYCD